MSWQQQGGGNKGNPSNWRSPRQQPSAEEGEIGEEEGEIIPNASSSSNTTNEATTINQPLLSSGAGVDNNPINNPSSSNPNVNNPISNPIPGHNPNPRGGGGGGFPPRRPWGPRPGRGGHFRGGGRGGGGGLNRHTSLPPGPSPMPMPVRSQSFTGYTPGGRGGGGGGGPPTAPPNRPTDPRFRGSGVTGAPPDAGPPPPPGGSFPADRPGPLLGGQQQQHPHHHHHHSIPPPLTSSYSSLAEPTTHVDSSDTHGGDGSASNFSLKKQQRGSNIFRSMSTEGPLAGGGGGRSGDSFRRGPPGPLDGPALSSSVGSAAVAAASGSFVGGINRPPPRNEFRGGSGSLLEHRSDSYRSLEGDGGGSSSIGFPPSHRSFQRNEGGGGGVPNSNFRETNEFGADSFGGGGGRGSGPPIPPTGPHGSGGGKRDSFRPVPPQGAPPDLHSQPPLPPETDGFRQRDGGFRPGGGVHRRENDFRGGGAGRGDGGPSSFRGGDGGGGGGAFYGSNDYHRSPSQRGRPLFAGGRGAGPAPPVARSLSQGGFGGRWNDPRFGSSAGMGDDGSCGVVGASLMDGDGSSLPPDARQHQGATHGSVGNSPDMFGRSREWGQSSRISPQGSPQARKAITSFLPSPSPPMDRKKRLGPGMQEAVASVEPGVKDDDNKMVAVAAEEENRLRTPALGTGETRGEKVIGLLADFLNDASLKKAETDEHSLLPTKQLILDAIEKMDTKIKETQKELVEKQEEFDEKIGEEARAKALADGEARAQARRKEEEEQRKEEDRRKKEDKAHGEVVQKIFDERKRVFLDEERKAELDLSERLRLEKQNIEKTLKIELEQQLSLTDTEFNKDLAKARTDLDSAIQNASKAEAELGEAELDYQNKLLSRQCDREADDTTRPSDIVADIISENRRKAAEAHLSMFAIVSEDDETTVSKELEAVRDPVFGKTSAQWANEAQKVTGLADALYSEPNETPYYSQNEKTHAAIAHLVKEYVKDKKDRLDKHWTELAEEAEFRRKAYEKEQKEAAKTGKQKHVFPARTSVIARTVMPVLESTGGRSTNNPYRRARRGNEVRSEYEQEQIIAEIAAKEAMEKRIAFGGCALPRQIGRLEKELSASFVNTFTSQRIDPIEIERDSVITNVWTDVEKCIFLDRFLQHPKDFRKIASFLRNKTAQDCVAFYYDSKHSIPFKGALKEHIMRRKRRGDYHVWDATIQAAISVGATIQAGPSEEKPLVFFLPEHDFTYHTRYLHPIKQEILSSMTIDEEAAVAYLDDTSEDSKRAARPSKKRKQYTLFTLDPEQRKFLRPESPDPLSEPVMKKSQSRCSVAESSDATLGDRDDQPPARKPPQKWTAAEKRIFKETLEKHGKNWTMLAEAVGTRSIRQIKNYYYDFKKAGKLRSEKKSSRAEGAVMEEKVDGATTPPPVHQSSGVLSPQATPINRPSTEDMLLSPWIQQVQQQQQQSQQPFSPASYHSAGTMELIAAHARQLELERGRPHSGSSTPDDISGLWAHAQGQQALLSQSVASDDAARHLLQHHSQAQHQQILSNLLPWLSTGQHQSQLGHSGMHDWTENQQLEALLRLQQHQRHHHHHQQSHQDVLASLGGSLHHLSLAGLTGLSSQGSALAGLAQLEEQQRSHHPQHQHHQHQHHQHQHHHQHQSQHQQHSQQESTESQQLALVQQLLSLQQQAGHSEGGSIADALNLLARMGGGHNHQG